MKAKIVIPELRNLDKLGKSNLAVSTKSQTSRNSHEVVRQSAEEDIKKRAEKIVRREPPKGLLLKQSKLLLVARTNNFPALKAQGYTYFETDVNVKDEFNNTPLYYAAKAGNLEFCQFLTDIGARVNQSCESGNTPLHMAFKSDVDSVLISLLTFIILIALCRL